MTRTLRPRGGLAMFLPRAVRDPVMPAANEATSPANVPRGTWGGEGARRSTGVAAATQRDGARKPCGCEAGVS